MRARRRTENWRHGIAPARRRRNAMAPIRCSYAAAAPASRGAVALTSFDRDCDLVRLNGRIERLMLPVGEHQLQRSEEHTSELQSLMRISYAVFCLKKKNHTSIHCAM